MREGGFLPVFLAIASVFWHSLACFIHGLFFCVAKYNPNCDWCRCFSYPSCHYHVTVSPCRLGYIGWCGRTIFFEAVTMMWSAFCFLSPHITSHFFYVELRQDWASICSNNFFKEIQSTHWECETNEHIIKHQKNIYIRTHCRTLKKPEAKFLGWIAATQLLCHPSRVALPRLCEGWFPFSSGAQQHWCTTGADFFESFWQSIKWRLMEFGPECPDPKADKSLTNQRPCSSSTSLAFAGCHSTRTVVELQDKRGLDSTRPDARQFDHTRDQRTAISFGAKFGLFAAIQVDFFCSSDILWRVELARWPGLSNRPANTRVKRLWDF